MLKWKNDNVNKTVVLATVASFTQRFVATGNLSEVCKSL